MPYVLPTDSTLSPPLPPRAFLLRRQVSDPEPGQEERLVLVSSSEEGGSPYCAAQDALIRCVLSLTADDAASGDPHRVRLLTGQASVGMVLGKRGATVTQLRQETGAAIKVLPLEEGGATAPGAAPGDEVIQVEGSMQQCVAALRGVATLLRGWQIRAAARGPPGGGGAALLPQPVPLAGQLGGLPFTNGALHGGGHLRFLYTLSNAQAGAVIGKGGQNISQIRAMSGAKVQVPVSSVFFVWGPYSALAQLPGGYHRANSSLEQPGPGAAALWYTTSGRGPHSLRAPPSYPQPLPQPLPLYRTPGRTGSGRWRSAAPRRSATPPTTLSTPFWPWAAASRSSPS